MPGRDTSTMPGFEPIAGRDTSHIPSWTAPPEAQAAIGDSASFSTDSEKLLQDKAEACAEMDGLFIWDDLENGACIYDENIYHERKARFDACRDAGGQYAVDANRCELPPAEKCFDPKEHYPMKLPADACEKVGGIADGGTLSDPVCQLPKLAQEPAQGKGLGSQTPGADSKTNISSWKDGVPWWAQGVAYFFGAGFGLDAAEKMANKQAKKKTVDAETIKDIVTMPVDQVKHRLDWAKKGKKRLDPKEKK